MTDPKNFREQLNLMTDSETKDLLKTCFYYAENLRGRIGGNLNLIESQDAVQTAIEKLLAGDRSFDASENGVLRRVLGVIKSIYLNDRDKKRREKFVNSKISSEVIYAESIFKPAYNFEEKEFILKANEFLKYNHPDLAVIFIQATKAVSKGLKTNNEVAKEIGISPSKYSKSKKAIQKIIQEWINRPEVNVEHLTGGKNVQQKTK